MFSTWGKGTPRGMGGVCRGYAEIKLILNKPTKGTQKWLNVVLGVHKRSSISIWGYASDKRLRTPAIRRPMVLNPGNMSGVYLTVMSIGYFNFLASIKAT